MSFGLAFHFFFFLDVPLWEFPPLSSRIEKKGLGVKCRRYAVKKVCSDVYVENPHQIHVLLYYTSEYN